MSQSHDPKSEKTAAEKVRVREASGDERPMRRTFPGPRGADAKLRVAVERGAHAELIAHAKESLDVEVCGVLIGQVCEDDEGVFVHVEAVIRGAAATQGSTRVTFTQATWNGIYATLERNYPKMKIVGWYHTHPGFGVEFSEMDLFIQRNFFPGATQIALVTDPLSGAVAICVNTPSGIEYFKRYWVDGREQRCIVPERVVSKSSSPAIAGTAAKSDASASGNLEERVSQLINAFDELRNFHYRFLMTCGILFCLALVLAVGYFIRSQWISRVEPPKLNQVVPVSVQMGDKAVILGVGITSWEVPPELNSILLQAELLKREEAEKAAKREAMKLGNTNNAATVTNSTPAQTNKNTP
jgi:proteasome lid subunit RPN8/RPN11